MQANPIPELSCTAQVASATCAQRSQPARENFPFVPAVEMVRNGGKPVAQRFVAGERGLLRQSS